MPLGLAFFFNPRKETSKKGYSKPKKPKEGSKATYFSLASVGRLGQFG
jgi:hypothetical protein